MIFGWGKKKKDQVEADKAQGQGLETPKALEDVSQNETPQTAEPVLAESPSVNPQEIAAPPASPVDPDGERVLDDASLAVQIETQSPDTTPDSPSEEDAPLALTPHEQSADIEAPEPLEEATPQQATKKQGFFARLTAGLRKSSSKLSDSVSSLFTQRKLDDEALEELEEILISADLGAKTALRVTTQLAKDRFDKDITDLEIKEALADTVAETLAPYEKPFALTAPSPEVILFVGVNGSGKTTTLGKIAVKLTREGKKVVTAAGDTFRAAAVEQLKVWSDRAGAHFMARDLGADAAGLAFDAIKEAQAKGADVVLIDTAGRLQNKAELMDELRKIMRVIAKVDAHAPHQVILVLDGTVGSNALSQAEAFLEASKVTGVVMTKLDGTAKGGALIQVADQCKLPIHYIGVGEGEEDLQDFSARDFARALAGLDQDPV